MPQGTLYGLLIELRYLKYIRCRDVAKFGRLFVISDCNIILSADADRGDTNTDTKELYYA